MRSPFHRQRPQSGVTLVELVVTIALIGILAVLAIQFAAPVRSYIDTTRRAALADAADMALRRIGRDVRLALPNSVRVDSSVDRRYVEFLQIRTGGRYREAADPGASSPCPNGSGTAAEDVLVFGVADTCFKTIGDVVNIDKVVVGDQLVVYNLAPDTPNADAYEFPETGGNKSRIDTLPTDAAGSERINFESNTFTYDSPGRRFFIIEGAVTYACDLTAGTLTKYWGYTISKPQPNPASFAPTVSRAILASGVTKCKFTYDTSVSSQGAGLLTMSIELSTQISGGATESVSLYHAIHVNNVP